MASVFRSKLDLWLIVVTLTVPLLVLGIAALGTAARSKRVTEILALTIRTSVIVFCAWLYFSASYTLTSEALLVKCGPFSWVMPLREISSIEPTRNLESCALVGPPAHPSRREGDLGFAVGQSGFHGRHRRADGCYSTAELEPRGWHRHVCESLQVVQ